MMCGVHRELSDEERSELFALRKDGASIAALARRFEMSGVKVWKILKAAGLNRPTPRYSKTPRCKHCKIRAAYVEMRNLCRLCFADKDVRQRYPTTGLGISNGRYKGLPCRHCEKRKVCRARGLCSRCYGVPAIMRKYPPQSNYRRGSNYLPGGAMLDSEPTDAEPGTIQKILVMERRASKGLAIFHPGDRRL